MQFHLEEQVNQNIERAISALTNAKQHMQKEWEKLRTEHEILQDHQQQLRDERLKLDKERSEFREQGVKFEMEKKLVEDKNLTCASTVTLNVGGEEITTSTSTLRSVKGTMIEAMFSGRHKLQTDSRGRYFLDRDYSAFRWVLMYLRSHKLQLPTNRADKVRVLGEFDYFCIPIEEQSPDIDFMNNTVSLTQTLRTDSWVLCLKVMNDLIVSGHRDNIVRVWDAITGNLVHVLKDDREDMDGVEYVDVVEHENRKMVISGTKRLKVWDLETNTCTKTLEDEVALIGFRLLDNKIYSMWEDGGIKIFDLAGNFIRKWNVTGCWVPCTDPSERYIVTESVHGYKLSIWDAKTEELLAVMEGHTDPICFVKIFGNRVLSGSYDKTINVWDLKTGQCLKTISGHSRSVRSIDVLGNIVVSGSHDKTLKIWNVERNQCITTLVGHQNTVSCVEIVGNMIVSGSWDNTIRIWQVDETGGVR